MLIDLILDRKDGQIYNAKEFYNAVMEYTDVFPSYLPVARAMDGGTEADVISELCDYVRRENYSPEICDYISSVKWLEDEDRAFYDSNKEERDRAVYNLRATAENIASYASYAKGAIEGPYNDYYDQVEKAQETVRALAGWLAKQTIRK